MTTLEDSFVRNPRPHEKGEVGGHDCFFPFSINGENDRPFSPPIPLEGMREVGRSSGAKGWEPPVAPHPPQARTEFGLCKYISGRALSQD